ncbi:hypothetical protein RJT34_02059 [Clitoria ternatea]|uniref:Uncharacterized protein n=1 Tax=Clitoria ternatea TaxID=43366 RepID=A0AAN9KK46_CLITE
MMNGCLMPKVIYRRIWAYERFLKALQRWDPGIAYAKNQNIGVTTPWNNVHTRKLLSIGNWRINVCLMRFFLDKTNTYAYTRWTLASGCQYTAPRLGSCQLYACCYTSLQHLNAGNIDGTCDWVSNLRAWMPVPAFGHSLSEPNQSEWHLWHTDPCARSDVGMLLL